MPRPRRSQRPSPAAVIALRAASFALGLAGLYAVVRWLPGLLGF